MINELLNTDVLWQMSIAEKAAIFYLLGKMKSKTVAVEVGSYKGGFTRVLSRHFDKVYSLDIDHSQIVDKEQFKNVVWVQGDSRQTLPDLIDIIEPVNLILIDGDHEYETVLADINNVLAYKPKGDMVLLIHDSWYAPTREAINKAAWNDNPYVHLVEKDFVPGDLIGGPGGNFFVGGLALAVLTTKKRRGAVKIGQAQDYMYRICLERV